MPPEGGWCPGLGSPGLDNRTLPCPVAIRQRRAQTGHGSPAPEAGLLPKLLAKHSLTWRHLASGHADNDVVL
jgi:hypothetical protein